MSIYTKLVYDSRSFIRRKRMFPGVQQGPKEKKIKKLWLLHWSIIVIGAWNFFMFSCFFLFCLIRVQIDRKARYEVMMRMTLKFLHVFCAKWYESNYSQENELLKFSHAKFSEKAINKKQTHKSMKDWTGWREWKRVNENFIVFHANFWIMFSSDWLLISNEFRFIFRFCAVEYPRILW